MFKAAPEETLKQALAAIERKKTARRTNRRLGGSRNAARCRLKSRRFENHLTRARQAATDLQSLYQSRRCVKTSAYELAKKRAVLRPFPNTCKTGFEIKYFPKGTGFPDLPLPEMPDLPKADGYAFSIDDESTTEVDDALSLTDLGNGMKHVGIHIASPSERH